MPSTSEVAQAICDECDSDVYFYNGPIERGADLLAIEQIHKEKTKKNAILVLVTSGGNPHAAYKITV